MLLKVKLRTKAKQFQSKGAGLPREIAICFLTCPNPTIDEQKLALESYLYSPKPTITKSSALYTLFGGRGRKHAYGTKGLHDIKYLTNNLLDLKTKSLHVKSRTFPAQCGEQCFFPVHKQKHRCASMLWRTHCWYPLHTKAPSIDHHLSNPWLALVFFSVGG